MSNIIDLNKIKQEKFIDDDFSQKTALLIAKHIATTSKSEFINEDRSSHILTLISHYLEHNYNIKP